MKKTAALLVALIILFTALPAGAVFICKGAETCGAVQALPGIAVLTGRFEGEKPSAAGFCWRKAGASEYSRAEANGALSLGRYNLQIEVEPGCEYEYYAYFQLNKRLLRGASVRFTALARASVPAADSVLFDKGSKYAFIFGEPDTASFTVDNVPAGFATAAEASSHMTEVTVPVWRLKGGKKYSSEWSFVINAKLAASVKAIFTEIYALPEKYPVCGIKTFAYRKIGGTCRGGRTIAANGVLSNHAFGTAIDLNASVNGLYWREDGRNAENPFFTTEAVIGIFKAHGWTWGGDWEDFVDTMHFQYLG